jgi:hypothetical protein
MTAMGLTRNKYTDNPPPTTKIPASIMVAPPWSVPQN